MAIHPAQLYRYNEHDVVLVKDTEDYFVDHFNPEIDEKFVHWLNYHSLENQEAIVKLCDFLGIDKLIEDDIFQGTKRPRIEEYPKYLFFSIQSALPPKKDSQVLEKERLSFLLGDNYLISFQQKKSDHFPSVRERIEYMRGKIRYKGPDFLLYRLLEAIVDNYAEVVEDTQEEVEHLDKLVLRNPDSTLLRRIELVKRKLVDLRKIVYPMKDLIMQIDRVENKLIIEDNSHYFQDLRDSCLSLIDEIDSQTQMLDGIANVYFAAQGQRMNEVMKVLTVTSAVFIPLTFIVGVYGMNFDYMPELKSQSGYFIVWGIMLTIAAVLVWIFWKRGWLKRNDK